jgi:hypothetical protein
VCKAALVHLTEQWPQAIAFDALLEHALKSCGGHETREAATAALASMLLTSYAAGALELHASPSPFVLVPGSHPAAGRWQRHQADAGERITTLRHQPINVDPTTRTLLGLLDGVRTRADVAALAWPGAPVREREMLLEQALPQIARQALLVA